MPGDTSDNSYHVVRGVTGAALDGFTIAGGNANSGWEDWTGFGGGMFNDNAAPTVAHCTFTSNSALFDGGGMFNDNAAPTVTDCAFTGNTASAGGGIGNSTSAAVVTNCTFMSNSASAEGGGMYNDSSSPVVTNCTFISNNTGSQGGGIYNYDSAPIVTNCTFISNSASAEGGGMYNDSSDSSSPVVTNCSFTSNRSRDGGGIYNYGSSPTVTNCILWGDLTGESPGTDAGIVVSEIAEDTSTGTTISYSIVQGGYPSGTNIITADPLFVNASNGNLHLKPSSPAIDAGNGCAGYVTLTDQGGNPRWYIASVPDASVPHAGNGVNIGAFEYQGTVGIDTPISGLCL